MDAAGNVIVSRPPPSAKQLIALVSRELIPFGKAATIAAILRHGGYSCSFKAPSTGRVAISWYLTPKGAHLAKAKQKPVLIAAGNSSTAANGILRRYLAAQLLLRAVSRASRVVNYLQAFASAQTRS